MATSDAHLIKGIEQRNEPVPAGYSYDPRRTPKLMPLDPLVAKRQPKEAEKEQAEA